MQNNTMNEPTPIPPDKILSPENVTDEQLDNMAPVFRAMERTWAQEGVRLQNAALAAAANQDPAGLHAALREVKEFESWQSKWADRLGHRTSDRHREVQQAFSELSNDISRAINGELPGQLGKRDAADWWKDSE